MNITDTYKTNSTITLQSEKTLEVNNATAATSSDKSSNTDNKTLATISGRALMLSRLFGSQAGNAEPPVLSGANGMDKKYNGVTTVNFLTEQDRSLLSDMYSYAQKEGIDLGNVDGLAITLGLYRKANNGRVILSSNDGYDLEGHRQTFNFNTQEAASAERIHGSTALDSTRVDRGFIQFSTNPDYGALGNAMDMRFLEKMVTAFSDVGQDNAPPSSLFSANLTRNITNSVVITTSKDVVLQIPAPDVESIDGKLIIHNPEAIENAKSTAQRHQAHDTEKQQINQTIIETLLSGKMTSTARIFGLQAPAEK